jgi:hypothetical protein
MQIVCRRRALFIGSTFVLLLACEDKRRHQPSDPVKVANITTTVPANAPPGDVARDMLSALADAQRARSRGLGGEEKKTAYDEALARIQALTARKEIYDQLVAVKSPNIPRGITPDAALTLITESWISQVAHYSDGVLFDTMRVFPDSPQTEAIVQVEAKNPAESEKLARLEAEVQRSVQNEPASRPAGSPSPALAEELRRRAIAQGFNSPASAGIELRLHKVDDAWRVFRVGLMSAPPRVTMVRQSSPQTSQPTSRARVGS